MLYVFALYKKITLFIFLRRSKAHSGDRLQCKFFFFPFSRKITIFLTFLQPCFNLLDLKVLSEGC